ncbi:hypothetical protein GCK32_001596 [Trichostrongylus colubriformis]|uniref:Uncharacterized protein n=1 Tax=Trichostrongylus colubriformis TaxID=6319 RepID=A0AAN8FU43_TRICO
MCVYCAEMRDPTLWKMLAVLVIPTFFTPLVSDDSCKWVWIMFSLGFASGQWCVPGAEQNSGTNIVDGRVRRNPSQSLVDEEHVQYGFTTESVENIGFMTICCLFLYSFIRKYLIKPATL